MSYTFIVGVEDDLRRVVTHYGSLTSLLPENYAVSVHRHLWENVKNPITERWTLCLQSSEIGGLRFSDYESRIVWFPITQTFQFPEVEFVNDVMDGPTPFPDLEHFDWRCLLKEEFKC